MAILSVEVVGKTIPLVPNVNTMAEFIVYMAKVSSTNQEDLSTTKKLIEYLIRNRHWSPFEMVNIAVEVQAPRDISRQILRHASAKFQEFSQRYAVVQNFTVRELRRQDTKNRQNSVDDFSIEDKAEFEFDCRQAIAAMNSLYTKWLNRGAAKECARVFLPEGLTMSKLYMNAPVRTWIHYLDVREDNGTQLEHIHVANMIRAKLHEIEPELF